MTGDVSGEAVKRVFRIGASAFALALLFTLLAAIIMIAKPGVAFADSTRGTHSRLSLAEASKLENYGCPTGTSPQFGWAGRGWYLAACNHLDAEGAFIGRAPRAELPLSVPADLGFSRCASGSIEQGVYGWRGDFRGTICASLSSSSSGE